MNAATATTSARAAQPDPTRAGARASTTSNAFAVLITLVFTLIQHGGHRAGAFRAHIAAPGHRPTARFFGTANILVIRASLRRCVMRCTALYQALRHQANRRLASQQPALPRAPARLQQGTANARTGTADQHTAPASTAHQHWQQYSDLFMAQPVAREVTNRATAANPPHLDFAATAETAAMFPHRLLVLIDRFGGCPTQFIAEVDRCQARASRIETPRLGRGPEHQRPNCLSAVEQLRDGPPPQAVSAEGSPPRAAPCAASARTFEQTETVPAIQWPVSPCPAQEVAVPASL